MKHAGKLVLMALSLWLAACASPGYQASLEQRDAEAEPEYITGSNIPHRNAQKTEVLSDSAKDALKDKIHSSAGATFGGIKR